MRSLKSVSHRFHIIFYEHRRGMRFWVIWAPCDTDTNQIGTVFKKYLSISCIDLISVAILISLFFVRPTTREACNFRYRSIPCWRTSISVWLFLLILGKSLPAYLVTSCTYFVPFILDKQLLQPVCALTVLLARSNDSPPFCVDGVWSRLSSTRFRPRFRSPCEEEGMLKTLLMYVPVRL